ncbi:hypothetical protein ACJ73_06232 [Blastomyces percursus]|uniref:Uncharacterized protein n=1 Tax=Blastomyces percursus TaxID=1658174 RepID=A0A1J9R473_9EURO|nr:hypothetical protein ACJ73_06232 [Blastomyces percursus]
MSSSIASDNRPDQAMAGAEDIAVAATTTSSTTTTAATTKDVPSPTAPKQSVPTMQTPGHPSFRRCVIFPPSYLRVTATDKVRLGLQCDRGGRYREKRPGLY